MIYRPKGLQHWVPRPRLERCAQAEVRDLHVVIRVQEEVLGPVPVFYGPSLR